MIRRTVAGIALFGLAAAWPAVALLEGAQSGSADTQLADLQNPSTRTRIETLHRLGEQGRMDAATPMAALLLDGNDDVQFAAVESLLNLYTVHTDLSKRPWGVPAIGRPTTLAESAFEAGPLATMPAAVPADVVANLAAVALHDDSPRIRLAAAYGLGVLGSPAMGPMAPNAVESVISNVIGALQHPDQATRQVVARVAGRVFAPAPGEPASTKIGDALVGAMNDQNDLVRRWAMDSLGLLHYDRAVQALTEHASYFGKGEDGAAAIHAIARIASPGSAPVLRALLENQYVPFRLLSIEGLGRIGDRGALPQIQQSAANSTDPGVALAAGYAKFLLGQTDIVAIADALGKPDADVQAKVYLTEISLTNPSALHPLLRTPNPSTRMIAAEILGACRRPDEAAALQPLQQDPSPEVVDAVNEAIRRLQAYAVASHQ
jgi:HEAT repeat protein